MPVVQGYYPCNEHMQHIDDSWTSSADMHLESAPALVSGQPPACVAQYVDALRLGNLAAFLEVEAESGDWWHPLLDRGAGAALHFAVDHGQARSAWHFALSHS